MAVAADGSSNSVVQLVCTQRGWKTYRVRGQMFEVEDRYTLTSIAGYGAYGVVCAAFDSVDFRDVAIKRVNHLFEDLVDGRRIWREICIQRILRENCCRNILNLTRIAPPREGVKDFRDLYIVTDLYDTDLHTVIYRVKNRSVEALQRIMVRVLRCLADMHTLGIIHRDLKPSNILLGDEPDSDNAVVCDFGLARAGLSHLKEPLDLTDYVVTRWYRPPELLLMCRYSFPIDMWAFGCIIAEYVIGRPLFGGRDYVHQMQLVLSSIPVTGTEFIENSSGSAMNFLNEIAKKYKDTRPLVGLLEGLSSDGVELVTKLLAFEPNKRLTAQQALQHPFFARVGGRGKSECTRPTKADFSFDLHAEISEAQLRRAIWEEMTQYQKKELRGEKEKRQSKEE
ncbi:putative mitogen-activated protein kinase 5 [Trypanosoma cruzi]|uniref:Mitogen-activated protein kinase 5, putative n=2 Tax=Trypanosoma cruzi TaxID=5693 RepID=Q4DHF7_TRYCC|nr:mitogen-activated protein kinase 5, putative [Trypanosoma cruzi]EAN91940.1 mitogen-activated protein kinase 5, putative [Trypanosoma cruzi]PWV07232.1 putative mitogen-activated protein kinase 5 [Trypanosoma cruzi]RNC47206.1 putative mitogen-activated protein kinase 5, putative,protein kinase [Trypanosoma cruzi]|eukprot:XP_813791.1 mitogen-activated protein kinase 5 [Trypanosoma cruzi strain CL Brener]